MKLLTSEIFGQNIKHIRKSRNLTKEETIARLQILGSPINRTTYSLIETGRRNIFISDLVGLQKNFNVNYAKFFKDIPTTR